ncbi:MAG TPA: hypothetical protein VL418_05265 [Devosiaceae bacterium]|jgi:hypothetical protein|nr:hypothetical protein [Devosiaceae bacterium]
MRSLRLLCAAGIAAILGLSGSGWDGDVPSIHLLAAPAQAAIGQAVTPHVYTGPVRRESRTVVRRTTVRVNTLPSYCVYGSYFGGHYYNCRGVYYEKSGKTYVKVVVSN